jgi:uncharacterized membrane protein YgaE (UPF0421/DUF939 family)
VKASRFGGLASGVRTRIRRGVWPVTQASVAAGLAWYLTHDLLGHPQPFFAPIAAAVSMSASNVLRSQRAVQLIAGVALGIGVGVGVGEVADGPVAIAGAVLIAMCLALTVGGGFLRGLMFVNQSAASAILVIALRNSATGIERLVDALIGGGVVLVISVLLFPADPLRVLNEASRNLGATLRDALGQLGEQISRGTPADRSWPMTTGQNVHVALAQLAEARATARIIVRVAPRFWRRRAAVESVLERSNQLDLLGNSILGLLRAAHAALTDREALDARVTTVLGLLRAEASAIAEHGLDPAERQWVAWPKLAPVSRSPRATDRGPLLAALADACLRDLQRLRGSGPDVRQLGSIGVERDRAGAD